METLTTQNMPDFIARLRRLLNGWSFAFTGSDGFTHQGVRLISVDDMTVQEGGVGVTRVHMDGVGHGFAAYFAAPDGEPLALDIETCRVTYEFTRTSLMASVQCLAPEAQGTSFLVSFQLC